MNERIQKLAEQAGMVKILEGHASEYGAGTFENTPYPELEKFAELIIEECAREVEEFARKWWSIHCHSNKHAETTRKAHDDFCALQAAIRRRGKTV
jgi:hypothetical protein